jgi:hypothetical protein
MKKMLNDGNKLSNYILGLSDCGSRTVLIYVSGSAKGLIKLRFQRFRNTAYIIYV